MCKEIEVIGMKGGDKYKHHISTETEGRI
jgi:hypothetical protein